MKVLSRRVIEQREHRFVTRLLQGVTRIFDKWEVQSEKSGQDCWAA